MLEKHDQVVRLACGSVPPNASRDADWDDPSTPVRSSLEQIDRKALPGPRWSARGFGHQRYSHRHQHPEGQLFVIDEGTCEILSSSERWLVRRGQPCWIPPHVVHEVDASAAIVGRSILIAEDLCSLLPIRPIIVHRADLIALVLDRLMSEDLGPARGDRLLAVLLDEVAAATCEGPVLKMPIHGRLKKLARDVADAPELARSLITCARAVGMSPRTFSRRFAAETGLSFMQWRCCARVIKAAELVQHGTSVTQAGLQVGYDSQSAFSAAFRHWMGKSPTEYRRSPRPVHRRARSNIQD